MVSADAKTLWLNYIKATIEQNSEVAKENFKKITELKTTEIVNNENGILNSKEVTENE